MIDFGHGVYLTSFSGQYCEVSHIEKSFEWRNDYAIWKWCRQNDVLSWSNHVRWDSKINKDPTIKMYAIYETEQRQIIGVCGLTDIDHINQRAEFSLYIAPRYQRKGYAKAALKTLFSHGFLNQNLNIIWGETFEGNPAYKMFLNLGMKHEGTRRQFYFKEGKHIDAHLVSMTRQEYMEASWKQTQL
jgi:RimJ/RimL family protein N-acetyltransferase